MQRDTIAEWQSLTQLYSEMSDGELYALDADLADLTEMAQQVLRDEMKKRGLDRQPASNPASNQDRKVADHAVAPLRDSDDLFPISEDGADDSDLPREYTWKTPLCDCEDGDYAGQLQAALKAAGIESWIEGAGFRVAADMLNPRILVAADQLEQAREIASRPIPQAIAEQFKMEIPEYEPPVCPKCGAEDPVLEGADPANSWLCESCGEQWTDPVAA
ncbi:MAG: DUF2007 domain-containing protein [Terracidiphilus sp.]